MCAKSNVLTKKKTHTQIYIHYWAILVVAGAVRKRYVHTYIKCSINRSCAGQTHRNCEYSFVKGGMRCDKWARTKHSMENLWYRVEHNMTQLDDNNEKYENVNQHEFQYDTHYILKSMTRWRDVATSTSALDSLSHSRYAILSILIAFFITTFSHYQLDWGDSEQNWKKYKWNAKLNCNLCYFEQHSAL